MSATPQLPGFQALASVPSETMDRYAGIMPGEVLTLWRTHGYGSAVNGFLKVIDPDHYIDRLGECLPRPSDVPVFATGLGDIVVWNGETFVLVKYRYNTATGLGDSIRLSHVLLADDWYLETKYQWLPYPAAVAMHGPLSFDECFGYVPILALGGREEPESLQKGDLITHIQLIAELAGPVRY